MEPIATQGSDTPTRSQRPTVDARQTGSATCSGWATLVLVHPLGTFNDRVWFAWHCLPRSRSGRPPPYAKLERREDGTQRVAYATISKIMTGERKSVDPDTLFELAEIFHVTPAWLQKGDGPPPTPTGVVPPRSEHERYAAYDPETWIATGADDAQIRLPAKGAHMFVPPRNNFEVAVHAMHPDISLEAIRKVFFDEAAGHENDRQAHHWGARLREAELLERAAKEKKRRIRTKTPKPKAAATRRRAS